MGKNCEMFTWKRLTDPVLTHSSETAVNSLITCRAKAAVHLVLSASLLFKHSTLFLIINVSKRMHKFHNDKLLMPRSWLSDPWGLKGKGHLSWPPESSLTPCTKQSQHPARSQKVTSPEVSAYWVRGRVETTEWYRNQSEHLERLVGRFDQMYAHLILQARSLQAFCSLMHDSGMMDWLRFLIVRCF